MKLKGKPDGSFLVRDSSDPRYILSLSFRSQGVTHHTRMEHYRGETHYFCTRVTATRCLCVKSSPSEITAASAPMADELTSSVSLSTTNEMQIMKQMILKKTYGKVSPVSRACCCSVFSSPEPARRPEPSYKQVKLSHSFPYFAGGGGAKTNPSVLSKLYCKFVKSSDPNVSHRKILNFSSYLFICHTPGA